MLEPTTLLNTPVPDPVASDPGQRRALLNLVNRRLITQGAEAIHLEQQIDQLVADLYKLSAIEKRALGMEA